MDDSKIAEQWDENAPRWAEDVRAGRDVHRDAYNNPVFFELLGDVDGLSILDAGCGEGFNTRIVARSGARLLGVDISSEMIRRARQEEQQEPLGIRYEVASMSQLSGVVESARFDVVISTMALMDCRDYEGAVGEFARALRPGGRLVFNVTHPCFVNACEGWQRDEEGRDRSVIIGDYLGGGVIEERWRFAAAPTETPLFTVTYFQRTLSELLNPLAPAGLLIDKLVEPKPSDEACERHPVLAKYKRIPWFLAVSARKVER